MAPPAKGKVKEAPVKVTEGFTTVPTCPWPHWDDASILQENWGASLAAVDSANTTVTAVVAPVKESKGGKGSSKDLGYFADVEGRTSLESYLEIGLAKAAGIPLPTPPAAPPAGAAAAASASASAAGGATPSPEEAAGTPPLPALPKVNWQRPIDIVKPFRPVVHRNATPFVDPYAESLQPIDAVAEEARYRSELAAQAATGNKRGESKDPAPSGPHHTLYPETISLLADLVGQDVSMWKRLRNDEAIKAYRELSPLMEPYDPTLVAGCAETPAEACGSRYSTALRHKLRRAEALAALKNIPPFMMSAFNSILRVVEHSQHLVGSGKYLWELIYPHAPGTCHPVYNPYGKYAVKLYVEGAYRKVLVDDAFPVDELGRPYLTITSRKELWPAILVKAIFKALGPAAHHAMTENPEVLLSCLMGNWVPQYMKPSCEPVASAALLMTYRMQLMSYMAAQESKKGSLAGHQNSTTTPALTESAAALAAASLNDSNARKEASGKEGGTPQQRKRSTSKKKTKAPGDEVVEGRLTAEEVCPPTDTEPIESKPMIVCGLRTGYSGYPTSTGEPSEEYATQLYTIEEIIPFRNTLALRLVTTPKTDIEPGIFETEQDAQDVRNIMTRSSACPRAGADAEREASCTGVWLTFEELAESVDALIWWRQFDKRYLNQVVMDSGSAATVAPPPQGNAKGRGAAAANAASSVPSTGLTPTTNNCVAWLCLTCEVTEEVAVVTTGPHPTALHNPNSAGGAPPPEVKAPPARKPAKAPAAKPTKRGNASKRDEAPPKEPTPPPEIVETPATTGHRTSLPWGEISPYGKLVHLDYYQWDRIEPLSQAAIISYETGKVSCSSMRLCPGKHILRVSVPEMGSFDRITFLSDAKMELKQDLRELTRGASIYSITDAGTYPSMENANDDYLWFKRRLRVSEPTNLTVALSTLLPSEDPAAHRVLLAPTVVGKGGGKGGQGGGGGGGRGGNSKGQPSQVPRETDGVDQQISSIPIMRYTRLILMNLDDGTQRLGEAGQLSQLAIEPNENGYLLLAFSRVPQRDAAVVEAAYAECHEGAEPSPPVSQQQDEATPPPSAVARLFGSGIWKVHLRSDRELSAFESTAHSALVIKDAGRLERGGPPTLFKRSCTVVEPTHLTMILNVKEQFHLPMQIRIWRRQEPESAAPPAPLASGSKKEQQQQQQQQAVTSHNVVDEAPVVAEEPPDVIYYETPESLEHIFIPDVLLRLTDKGKPATYIIEGSVSPTRASAWEEYCRQAQEHYFLDQVKEAEQATAARLQEELAEYEENPEAFLAKRKELHLQQQQAALELADRAAKDSNTASGAAGKGRRRSQDNRKKASGREATRSASRTAEAQDAAVASVTTPLVVPTVPEEFASEDLLITYTSQMLFSSAKVDVKTATPPSDPLALIRQHWQDAPFKEEAGGTDSAVTSATPPRSSLNSATAVNAKARQQQLRDQAAAAAEVLYRQEHARRSRQRFLKNPKNVLMPYASGVVDDTPRESNSRTGGRGQRNSSTQPLGLEDTEENNFRHQPPLDPSDYSVVLLPIRCSEVCAPTLPDGATPANAREGRRAGRGGAVAKGNASTAPGGGGGGSGTPSHSGGAALVDESVLSAMRESLTASGAAVAVAVSQQRDALKADRAETRAALREHWRKWHQVQVDQHAACAVQTSSRPNSSAAAAASAVPLLVFSSPIGSKDDENASRSRKSIS